MAHYVAELMERARTAPLERKDAAQTDCARAIFELWSHFEAFPRHSRAYESLDSVLEVLVALSPETETPFYRNHLWRALAEKTESSEVAQLLTNALGVDHAARALIEDQLASAIEVAAEESEEWRRIALELAELEPVTELRIRIVDAGDAMRKVRDESQSLRDRITQLDAFTLLASQIREELQAKLTALKGAPNLHEAT